MIAVVFGNANVLVLGLGGGVVIVPTPAGGPPEAKGEVCASATQGIAISATGATQARVLFILFIPPPCLNVSTMAARL